MALGLFGVSVSVSQIECESTSSCAIAGCLFPYLYTSIFVWVMACLRGVSAAAYIAHINEQTEANMPTPRNAYMRTHWTDHLAPAAARLIQNTTRLGRWQLHQEVGPQQAKGPCAHKSWPDTSRSGGGWRLAGWQPRKGGRAAGSWKEETVGWKKGKLACPFSWVWLFALWGIWSIFLSFVFLLTLLSIRLALLFGSCPIGQLLSTQSHLEPGCLFLQELKLVPQCKFTHKIGVFSLLFRTTAIFASIKCEALHYGNSIHAMATTFSFCCGNDWVSI